tara:strand:- start:2310 stop:3335 length:1026 start_codon:yes stop_codon:yes gene_type:complete
MNHYLKRPDSIQFEISSNCNALCQGCARQDGLNLTQVDPRIPKNQFMDVNDYIRVMSHEFFSSSIYEVFFCGTIDDPIMHPKFHDFVDWTVKNTDLKIFIDTNGAARSPTWWSQLAALSGDRVLVKFNVDGSDDTNAMNRQFTRFDRIMENAQAYIDAGGRARWQMIEFNWNSHQIDTARRLSEHMGFEDFKVRRNNVTDLNQDYDSALETRIRHETRRLEHTWETYLHSVKQHKTSGIKCRFNGDGSEDRSYMVSYAGEIWPCCFVYNIKYQGNGEFANSQRQYEEKYGKHWNSIHHNSIDDIVNGPLFSNDLATSWDNLTDIGTGGCNPVCVVNCGGIK